MPAEFIPHLFDNFTQASNARPAQGSGLGLAIVKGLVESAGGEVWYEHLEPRGACFFIRFQRSPEPPSERVLHSVPTGVARDGHSTAGPEHFHDDVPIAIVDDDLDL